MAEVKKMFNAVTLDQEFASDVWFALYDAAQNCDATGVDHGFMELADRLALKMYDQDCGLSSKLEAADLLGPWMKPIVDRIRQDKCLHSHTKSTLRRGERRIMEDPWKNLVLTKNVPVPEHVRRTTYPWERFEVGDSAFFEPDSTSEHDTAARLKNRLDQSARTFSNKQAPAWKFVMRVTLEEEKSGVRVWRLE